MRIILLFTFLLPSVFSTIKSPDVKTKLTVSSKKFSFILSIDKDSIDYRSRSTFITVNKRRCNKDAIKFFEDKLKYVLKSKSVTSEEYIALNINDKEYKLDPTSRLSQYLGVMNIRIQKLKMRERISCE